MQGRRVDGDAVAADLNSAAIHLLRGMRATDQQSGLSTARLSALSVLVFGGPCTMSQLARAEDVSAPTMTRIVDALCELGHASRHPHPDNSRMVVVTATPAGEALMRAAANRRFATIAAALATPDACRPGGHRQGIQAPAPPVRRTGQPGRVAGDA